MEDFPRRLLTEWRRLELPREDAVCVVGVSGGADSVSLALALHELRELKKLRLRFVIAHFNHRLRGRESDEDEKFVRELSGRHGFELALETAGVSPKGNLEQNARDARYRFLSRAAANVRARFVLTGHTVNDQAETFVMNLLRGSGLEGLGGIRTQRTLGGLKSGTRATGAGSQLPTEGTMLLRPLLRWARREDTEHYCDQRGVVYRYDTMNDDLAFQRVRIRKVLMPLLEDLNPHAIDTLARTAMLLQDDFEALRNVAEPLLDEIRASAAGSRSELPMKPLRGLFPSMRRAVVRSWIEECRGDLRRLEAVHFQAIDDLLFSRKSGRDIQLPGRGIVRRSRGRLVFMENDG